ncbi:hypothetical protein [Armatimonas rosea]|uniref:Uncharacterized protein n=1 Tax=Armatimonas rosea TaxID=685828 RepID=A0A7W9STE6_ARMRO|nr:hypothetical protein [Armatimonas rosea]MBB6052341.1 hypothetical protein [Armatimonas rosea]
MKPPEIFDPNTSPETLRRLARRDPVAFCQNPAAPLLLLENPLFFHFHPVRLLQILRNESLPGWLVAHLALHRATCVREAAQLHIALAGEATEPWTGKCRASASASTLRRPWRANRWQDRLLAAQSPSTTRQQLHQLKRDGNRYVRYSAQQRLLADASC